MTQPITRSPACFGLFGEAIPRPYRQKSHPSAWRLKMLKRAHLFAFLVLLFSSQEMNAGFFVFNPDATSGSYALVPNGSFETGNMTSWSAQIQPGHGSFQASMDEAFLGNWSAKAIPNFSFVGPGFDAITGLISVQPGEQYVLSGFFKTANITGGELYLDLNDAPFEVNTGAGVVQPLASDWYFAYDVFTVPAFASSVRVRMVRDFNVAQGQFGYVDGVALTRLSEFQAPVSVPEPSALFLLGSGIVALVTWRRQMHAA